MTDELYNEADAVLLDLGYTTMVPATLRRGFDN